MMRDALIVDFFEFLKFEYFVRENSTVILSQSDLSVKKIPVHVENTRGINFVE